MNFAFLSIICCMFLSHVNYASETNPTQKPFWTFPVARAVVSVIAIPFTTKKTNEVMPKNLSESSLATRQSIAQDGYGSELDHISLPTPAITLPQSNSPRSKLTPTRSPFAQPVNWDEYDNQNPNNADEDAATRQVSNMEVLVPTTMNTSNQQTIYDLLFCCCNKKKSNE